MFGNSTQKNPFGQLLSVQKRRGETLADLLVRVLAEQNIGIGADGRPLPMTYAGRLDPMAEGLVLVLTGELCKQKAAYAGRDKAYDFTVLLGVKTDTGDVLGKIVEIAEQSCSDLTNDRSFIAGAIANALARDAWPYPAFSSKPVDGVPLFMRAKAGSLPSVLPVQKGALLSLSYLGERTVSRAALRQDIIRDVGLVRGDFRQESIVAGWQRWGSGRVADSADAVSDANAMLVLLDFSATVSSGFYIRTLAEYIGECLGVPALAYRIARTEIASGRQ